MEGAQTVLNNLLQKYDPNKHKEFNQIKIQESISSILYILISISMGKDKVSLIKELYQSDNKLDKIFVYGDFFELDFSNLVIWNSRFDGYTKFTKSKFNNTQFYYTEFQNMNNLLIEQQIWDNIVIDESCETNGFIKKRSESKKRQNKIELLKTLFKKINNKQSYIINRNKASLVDSMKCLESLGFVAAKSVTENIEFRMKNERSRDIKQFLKNGSTSSQKIQKLLDCLEKS